MLIEEVNRGNPYFKEVLSLIKGLPARFDKDALFERTKISIAGNNKIKQKDCISMLWDAGIIGVEVCCTKDQQQFHAMLPDEAKKVDHSIKGENVIRGYFFEYNTDDDIHQVLSKYDGAEQFEVKIVFHPKAFDTLISQATLKWPIGI